MSDLWLPRRHDDFVESLQRQIARFAERHGAAIVEVELRDGWTETVSALTAEPGDGFVTLTPHGGEAREVIVPLVSIVRVTLSAASDEHPLGFAVTPPT